MREHGSGSGLRTRSPSNSRSAPSTSKRPVSRVVIGALIVCGIVTYLLLVNGLFYGLAWLAPLVEHQMFFPFFDPRASVVDAAMMVAFALSLIGVIALRRRQGTAGALLSGLLVLLPTAAVVAWGLHLVNAFADRSEPTRTQFRVVGYFLGGPKGDRVVVEPTSFADGATKRCVGSSLLGGWPLPGARVDIETRSGALGWRWISGFVWNRQLYGEASKEVRQRYRLDLLRCTFPPRA